MYRLSPAKWPKLPMGARVAVWMTVPNPECPPECIVGDFEGWEMGEHGNTIRLRTMGRMRALIPADDIDSLFRQRQSAYSE